MIKGESIVNIIVKPFRYISRLIVKKIPKERADETLRNLRMLNPSERSNDLEKRYSEERITRSLIITSAGIVISLVCLLSVGSKGEVIEGGIVKRNGYGQGERTEEFEVKLDGKKLKDRLVIDVGERQYSDEEIEEVFSKIKKKIPKVILPENTAAERVENDLSFVGRIDDYPVDISYISDDFEVIDSEGHISESFDDADGKKVTLTIILDYREAHDEIEFPIKVYPKKLTGDERTLFEIRRETRLDAESDPSSDHVKLPLKMGKSRLEYSRPASDLPATLFILGILAAVGVYFAGEAELRKAIEERERQMISDYPELVSKITLLLSASMTMRGAFEKICHEYEKSRAKGRIGKRYAYEEMLITLRQLQSGKSEAMAYQEFGTRTGIARYNKLGSILSQNLKKGNAGLLEIMEYEARDAFEDRKAEARKLGEQAGTKLLLPMGMMLLVVLVIVIVPSIMSFGF